MLPASNTNPGLLDGPIAAVRTGLSGLAGMAALMAPIALRIALAMPFLMSGMTKWDGFLQLAPAASYLFEDEFKLHIFGQLYDMPAPDLMALLDGIAEIVLPIFLIVGLATRLSALALLVMTGVIQLVVPEGWANFHLPWAALAIAIIAIGPGSASLDRLLDRLAGQTSGGKA